MNRVRYERRNQRFSRGGGMLSFPYQMGAEMTKTSLFTLAACTAAASAAVAIGPQTGTPSTSGSGGTVTYWMSADTTSGLGAAMGGQSGGRPNIMSMMIHGGPRPDAFTHALKLELGSPRRAAGAPAADHFVPAGLNAGASLPLVTPERASAPPAPPAMPGQNPGQMNGRILIYWGCGEHARPGQPYEIDMAQIRAGHMPPAMAQLAVRPMVGPNMMNATTYGEWPNQRSRTVVPANGSLVGEHLIRGNYSPDIRFTLAPGQDFLAPIAITSNSSAPSGAVPVAWQSVPGARAYFLMAFGGGPDNVMVMWTSSELQFAAMGGLDYLAPDEIARLIAQRALLPPSTTQCTVPAEVASHVQAASLMMTAFGPEANFSYPERPARPPRGWAPDWVVKLRTRSLYMGLLGRDMAAMMRGQDQPQPEPRRRRNPLGAILGH
jgi:hypothetical protein